MAKTKTLHKSVVERSFNGRVVRFRPVEGVIYIPITDLINLFQCKYSDEPVYLSCSSFCRIEFYKGGGTLACILPYDLENLIKKRQKRQPNQDEVVKIAWVRQNCKELLTDEPSPDSALRIFSNEDFGEVRVDYSNNEPTFCLADVCKIIGISNTRNVKSRLDKDDVRQMDAIDALGRKQKYTFITESGLYDTLLRSDSPKAKPFRKWITKEVIPSIRKTGGYVISTPDDNPEVIMARGLMAAQEALKRAESRAIQAEERLFLIEPKADYYDVVITDRKLFTTTQIASELGISYASLRKALFQAGIITSLRKTLRVMPEYTEWGITDCANPLRRDIFKWNHVGRANIIKLISPNMPI